MTSYPTDQFTSAHETNQQTTWTKGHSLEGQETLVVDSSYDFYDPIPTRPAEHSSTSSLSSLASIFSNTIEGEEVNEPTKIQQHIPSFENTSDWDRPSHKETSIPDPPKALYWPDGIKLILKSILWFSILSWIYQVYSCIDLKQMPTERLYAVDPGAPINVWIPVFQWTCWKQGWFGKYPASTLWIIGTTIGLYWLHWKRR